MHEHPSFISRQIRTGEYYFFDLDPPHDSEMRNVCGGWEACKPTYRLARHDFPYFSVEFVTGGEGRVVLGGRSYRLLPGAVFHYGPGLPHEIESDSAAPLEKYFVDFVGTSAAAILRDVPYASMQPLYLASPAPVRRLFEELNTFGASRTARSLRLCSVLVEELLLRVAETAAPIAEGRSKAWTSFERCRRYIQNHCLSIRTLDEVASACGVNKAYLCRLFKRYGQETPYQMLTRLRMDRAAELLLRSDLLVKQVAEAVDFDDPYHFSRVFRRVRGVSPAAFALRARRRLGGGASG